ncbi:hypothetical protein QTP88_019623 [Uroleucon formosanum]
MFEDMVGGQGVNKGIKNERAANFDFAYVYILSRAGPESESSSSKTQKEADDLQMMSISLWYYHLLEFTVDQELPTDSISNNTEAEDTDITGGGDIQWRIYTRGNLGQLPQGAGSKRAPNEPMG